MPLIEGLIAFALTMAALSTAASSVVGVFQRGPALLAMEGRFESFTLGRQLEVLVAEQPYRERLRRLQMLALYHCRREPEALRVYNVAWDLEPGAARSLSDRERVSAALCGELRS